MRTGIVAFLLGNVSLLYWPYLPSIQVILLIFGLVLVLSLSLYKARKVFVSFSDKYFHFCFLGLFLLMGFVYTALYIKQLYPVLDLTGLEGKTITVTGTIDSIPEVSSQKQRFDYDITARKLPNASGSIQWDESFKGKVQLSWYDITQKIENGQSWQMDIRLKKPNGMLNGGFDYEKWLYQNHILAKGYVREGVELKNTSRSFRQTLLTDFRQKVSLKLDELLRDHPYKGLIKALTIGVRHDIETRQWDLFLRTGTNHLIAISGLHIGLMSSIVWFLMYIFWKSRMSLNLRFPAHYMASVVALAAAFVYAALAGFAIPTQRALMMLALVFAAIMINREFLPSYVLLMALLLVILIDPMSSLSPGFWLSFSAVAIILLSISSRLYQKNTLWHKMFQLGRIQWAIFIGLFPLMFILFHQFSLTAPVANLLAVPLMSLIIVPVALLATLISFVYEPFGQFLFSLLSWPIDGLFWFLELLNQWEGSLYYLPETSWFVLLLVFMASLWLLLPRGWPGRWLGVVVLLPAFFMTAEKIPEGQVHLTVLDVGQGLAMVLRTQNHTLIYDTGEKYSEQFNMADAAIIPYLRLKGARAVDLLVVSHSDRDHAGSFNEIMQQLPVKEILAGEPDLLNKQAASTLKKTNSLAKQCHQGQQWHWDNVSFKVLSPVELPVQGSATNSIKRMGKNNNFSCVIHITTANHQTILLTGDIEEKIEKQILSNYPDLNVDVLQVPHHGSRTSSSVDFLDKIQPEIAVFSYGYRNRFKHPAKKVVQSYKKIQTKLYNTANGAIDIRSNITNNSFSVQEYRLENQHFWHRTAESL